MVRARPERIPVPRSLTSLLSARARPFLAVAAALCLGAGLLACGGDDAPPPEEEPPPPPPPPTTSLRYDATDPCTTDAPAPNSLFFDANGVSERSACPPPADPIDAAVFRALLNEGATVDSVITLPVDGTFDGTSLSSTVTFSFTSSTGPSNPQVGLPPIVVLKLVGAATAADGWEVVETSAAFTGGQIRIQPNAPLDTGAEYTVIATRGLRDLETPTKGLVPSAEVSAVTGMAPVSIANLDATATARLERQRQALQPVLDLLASDAVDPQINRTDIVSIHTFTTQKGFERMTEEVARYYEAIANSVYDFDVTLTEVSLPSIFIGVPADAYPNVGRFFRGVIKAPRFLGDDGRWRRDWATNAETIDIHFTISEPVGVTAGPVVVHVPGYGRGSVDGRSVANGMAQIPAAYVMTIDMRCHGFRGPDTLGDCGENRTQAEIDMLVDATPNNDNPDIGGPDGIPDQSGVGFFPGDPVALRDSQMASVFEILHVLSSLRDPQNYQPNVSPNVSRIHLIAQGYMASLGLMAVALVEDLPTRNMTVMLPSGGYGLPELIFNAPVDQRGAFTTGLPENIDDTNYADLFDRLSLMYEPLNLANYTDTIAERLSVGNSLTRVLLSHSGIETFVTATARQALIDAVDIQSNRVSEHRPVCDDFHLHSCTAGQEVILQATAVEQLVRFVDSRGVTVVPPAQ